VRAQIDLLVEQQIAASLWVKLPPGKIWQSELVRYQSSFGASTAINSCQKGEIERISISKQEKQGDAYKLSCSCVNIESLPNSQLRREYFLIVLSPQFCSLILAYRPVKIDKNNNLDGENIRKNSQLLVINTVESRIIQQVLDGMKQLPVSELFSIVHPDFICPSLPDTALIHQLLCKQIQRQEELHRQITTKCNTKLQQQTDNLIQKEHLKDEYLTNVCQELRTPLTHMKTALSLLNSPSLKPPQRQRYLQMLNHQCDRQNSLIIGLLDLLQLEQNLEATKLEAVRLSDIVPGVVSTYQPLAQEKGIMLAYTVPTELPDVWCVNGGLRQIVINLLHNSIKFTPTGGQVWVRARLQDDEVQLEFRDTGIGIAESDIPKIFDRFYRVRTGIVEESNGAGLGLTIVEQLLKRCGGSISVKSKLYAGSLFTVHLAKVSEAPEEITTEYEC
jgi:signal transduction histidine kinase